MNLEAWVWSGAAACEDLLS